MIGRRSHDEAQSFEDALNGAAPRDEHLADLVRFAEGICEAAVVEPSQPFRDSLRAQLMTEAATTLVAMPPEPRQAVSTSSSRSPLRRRVATVTAALVVVAGGAGLVASSASALPGDMLYPLKRTVETVELQLHRDDASRGSFQLDRAAERLAEARQLNTDGRSTALIADTLDDFSDSAEDGSSRLFTEYSATGEEETIRTVNDFVAASSADLSELSTALPEEAADAFEAAKAAVTDLASEASTLCGSCARPDTLPLLDRAKESGTKESSRKPSTTSNRVPGGVGSGSAPSTEPGAPVAPQPAASSSAPKAPAPAAPTTKAPVPTPKAPSLTDVTDPLLGGLLGDETQEGLVPGLLNGLLGNQTPKP